MRYYYVPSTYRGYKFGTGIRAGAMKGYGAIAGGNLSGGFAATTVDTPSDLPALPPEVQDKVEKAEETGKPAEIGKKNWELWSAIKNDAGNLWDMAKSGVKNLGSKIGEQYEKLPDGVKKGVSVGSKVGLFALGNPTIRRMVLGFGLAGGRRARFAKGSPEAKAFMARLRAMRRRGKGYSGGMRLRKGSPEAKAYMARLRAMRRRGRGYSGGAFKGVSLEKMKGALQKAQRVSITHEDGTKEEVLMSKITDANGKNHMVRTDKLANMISAGEKLLAHKLWLQEKKGSDELKEWAKDKYGKGKYRKPPYKYMTKKRFNILWSILNNANERHRIPPLTYYTNEYNGQPRATEKWVKKWATMEGRHRYPGKTAQGRKIELREEILNIRKRMKRKARRDRKKRKYFKNIKSPELEEFSGDEEDDDVDDDSSIV